MPDTEEHQEAERWEILGWDELLYWKLKQDSDKDKEFYANQKEVNNVET